MYTTSQNRRIMQSLIIRNTVYVTVIVARFYITLYVYIYWTTYICTYIDYRGTTPANISQSFTIPRTSEFYSDLSIAATLPIQIVSHVYEPFSRGVVSPCSTLLSHTNLLCEEGHRTSRGTGRS